VTAIGETKIDIEHPLNAVLSQSAPGDTVRVTILRSGQELTVDVTLGVRPANP
jgi:S1-C subfamily serine protease